MFCGFRDSFSSPDLMSDQDKLRRCSIVVDNVGVKEVHSATDSQIRPVVRCCRLLAAKKKATLL